MHVNKPFSHGRYHATLYAFRGTVADPQQNRTVHTHVSGGGGVIPAAQSGLPGIIDSVRSTNTEYVHERFFLVDEAASQETDIALTDWNFPVRAGHDVAFCWLVRKGKNSGSYVYGANYSLDQERFHNGELPIFNPMRRKGLPRWLILMAIPIAFLCALLATDFYACVGQYGSGYIGSCLDHTTKTLEQNGFGKFFLYGVLGFVGGLFASNILLNIIFSGSIKRGIAAEKRLLDEIRALCREARAVPK